MYDILICGAGPAGSNLARLLGNDPKMNQKYSVAIVDKRALDAPHDSRYEKACGGLLSPDAQKLMGQMGLTLPNHLLEDPQLFRVKIIDFDHQIESYFKRHYLNIHREKFDRYLFQMIPDTVHTICGKLITHIQAEQDHWHVTFSDFTTIRARFLVGADGANSFVRRHLFPNQKHRANYISIQKWYPLQSNLPYYTGVFSKDVTNYYSWTIQKSQHFIVGTAIPVNEKNVHQNMALLERKLEKHLGLNLETSIKTESAFIERTSFGRKLCFTQNYYSDSGKRLPLAFIGEASGATSPTSAEGFSYAFKTSLNLYHALSLSLNYADKRYQSKSLNIRLNILLKNFKSPGMYFLPLRDFALRFLGEQPSHFDSSNHKHPSKSIIANL